MRKHISLFAIAIAVALAVNGSAEPYNNLFRIMNPNGECLVKLPAEKGFKVAQKGKAYPYGTDVVCGPDSSLIVLFTETDAVRLMSSSTAKVFRREDGQRVVNLEKGLLVTRISPATTNDVVIIDTPIGSCSQIIGNCKVDLGQMRETEKGPLFDTVELRAEAMSKMKFVGDQFIIPLIKNNYGVKVTSSLDNSYTYITDLIGDYKVLVNTGLERDPEGAYEENEDLHSIKMSAKSVLKIWRKKAPLSDRIIAAVFATNPTGTGSETFAFAVGQSSIASQLNIFADAGTNAPIAALDSDATQAVGDVGASDDAFGGEFAADDGFGASEELPTDDGGAFGDEAAPAAEPVNDDAGLYDFLF